MVRLEMSEALKRKIRQDAVSELMTPTWTQAEEAIRAGRIEQGLELMYYGQFETRQIHDRLGYLLAFCINFTAASSGEEQLEKLWRYVAARQRKIALHLQHQKSAKEQIQLSAEAMRGHSGGKTDLGDGVFVEEADRCVLTLSPCGTGGRIRKMGEVFGRTSKAYPWSWNQSGVPYYCTHCCVVSEIVPIETYGYPLRIHENANWYQDPCKLIFYKSPELIPEYYFERVGKKRDASKLSGHSG